MKKIKLDYQKEIIEREKTLSNEKLFNEVIDKSGGDDYDGGFTTHGAWEFDYLLNCLRNRLANWFNENK